MQPGYRSLAHVEVLNQCSKTSAGQEEDGQIIEDG